MAIGEHRLFKLAVGTRTAIMCGPLLGGMCLGKGWANASYDYVFLLGRRGVTNPSAMQPDNFNLRVRL